MDKVARAASPDRLRAEPGQECLEGLVGWGLSMKTITRTRWMMNITKRPLEPRRLSK